MVEFEYLIIVSMQNKLEAIHIFKIDSPQQKELTIYRLHKIIELLIDDKIYCYHFKLVCPY